MLVRYVMRGTVGPRRLADRRLHYNGTIAGGPSQVTANVRRIGEDVIDTHRNAFAT